METTFASPYFHVEPELDSEMDLCGLLQTMKLDNGWVAKKPDSVGHVALTQVPLSTATDVALDVSMSEDLSCPSDTSESSTSTNEEPLQCGCSFLRSIQAQLENYTTTGGAYLEILFSHREAAAAFPRWHVQGSCVRGFSDLAEALASREWRADRDEDAEAATSFRYEALRIAVCG